MSQKHTENSTTKDSSLTFEEAQLQLDQWIAQFEEGYFPTLAQMARITEEVGELARAVSYAEGIKKPKEGEVIDEVIDELGDILLVLVCFANAQKISLAEAFQRAFSKIEVRDKNRWTKKT